MTGHQASPARPGLPATHAATARTHDPAGHHPAGRRPADLPLAAARKTTGARDTPSAVYISAILGKGDIVTGVRGATDGNVILTGAQATGTYDDALPFLYEGTLTGAAEDQTLPVLNPPFPGGIKTATFYGPDTNSFNPDTIPAGQVLPVGSHQTMTTPPRDNPFVINHGMIYLGPVSGQGGSWTPIDVPPDGSNTAGGVRACPPGQPGCFVMDTIAHSTMGDLVVGKRRDYGLVLFAAARSILGTHQREGSQ